MSGSVSGRGGRHTAVGGKELNCVGNASFCCFGAVYLVTAIVLQGGSYVPAINFLGGPGAAHQRLDVYKDVIGLDGVVG